MVKAHVPDQPFISCCRFRFESLGVEGFACWCSGAKWQKEALDPIWGRERLTASLLLLRRCCFIWVIEALEVWKKMKWNRLMWLAGRTSRGQRVSWCLPGPHVPCTPGRWKSSSKKPAGEAFASEGAESPRIYNPHGDPESSITVWGYQQVLGKELCCGKLSFFFFLGRVMFHCTGSCWMCLWDSSFKRKAVCSSWFPVWGTTFPDLGDGERVRTHRDSSSLQLSLFFFFLFFDCAGCSLCTTWAVHCSTPDFFNCSAGSVVVTHLTGALGRPGSQTRVPCIGRRILNHRTTGGVPSCPFLIFIL